MIVKSYQGRRVRRQTEQIYSTEKKNQFIVGITYNLNNKDWRYDDDEESKWNGIRKIKKK